MNNFLRSILKALSSALQFVLAVSITVLVLSVIPILIVTIIGLVAMALASFMTIMLTCCGGEPMEGFMAGMLFLVGSGLATIVAIALVILLIIFAVALISLPTSLLVQTVLHRKEIKSWLMYLTTYSFAGGLAGILLGLLALLTTWKDLKEFQYFGLATFGIMIFSILFGILSVNICGITLSTTKKAQGLVRRWLTKKQSRLMSAQGVV